jgi:hypothetical protein
MANGVPYEQALEWEQGIIDTLPRLRYVKISSFSSGRRRELRIDATQRVTEDDIQHIRDATVSFFAAMRTLP